MCAARAIACGYVSRKAKVGKIGLRHHDFESEVAKVFTLCPEIKVWIRLLKKKKKTLVKVKAVHTFNKSDQIFQLFSTCLFFSVLETC